MKINKGDKVKKQHPYDGTPLGGVPVGTVLTVLEVKVSKAEPYNKTNLIAELSDGTWEYVWNLTKENS